MAALYAAPEPLCSIPDKGMFLAPRRANETPVQIVMSSPVPLLGLPEVLTI